ncbi:MAG: hypothetical protein LBJ72_06295 [Dysgonamonadaceae bacterium]|nr:hypothetical protein [Dysgonamonadaceae bacterium]
MKINTLVKELKVFNFDDETLLVYEDVIVDPGIKDKDKDKDKAKKNPYNLISKKDGSLISVLNIRLPKRYSNRIVEMVGKGWREILVYYESSMYYGQDFAIADISSDTLYLLTQNKKLTPLLTRKPSVHASSEPRTVWTSLLTTDKFILISTILLDHKSSGRTPVLMHEFKTGETSAMSILDAEYELYFIHPSIELTINFVFSC